MKPEAHADDPGQDEADGKGLPGKVDGELGHVREQLRRDHTEDETDNTPGRRDHHGLRQKLHQDIFLAGTHGAADPDFLDPFLHGKQKQVRQDEAGDNEGNDAHDSDEDDERPREGHEELTMSLDVKIRKSSGCLSGIR